jgi:hypothetical protein
MLGDSRSPSLLYTSCSTCFKDNDRTEDSTAGCDTMKQPLIIESNESLKDEGQAKLSKERQSRSVICKSFLLGCLFGFALQAMSYAAYYTLFKMFGKEDTAEPRRSFFSYALLVLISQLHIAILIATWLTIMYTSTKSGSLYMRKKFDKDAANPNNSGSIIWTTRRMLFMFGVYFLVGVHAGSFSLWVIVNVCMGMVIPWNSLFLDIMIDFVTLLFMPKWFDCWSHPVEQELEDDHSCIAV